MKSSCDRRILIDQSVNKFMHEITQISSLYCNVSWSHVSKLFDKTRKTKIEFHFWIIFNVSGDFIQVQQTRISDVF